MYAYFLLVLRVVAGIVAILLELGLDVGMLVLFVCWEDVVPWMKKKIRSRFSGDTADAEPYPN